MRCWVSIVLVLCTWAVLPEPGAIPGVLVLMGLACSDSEPGQVPQVRIGFIPDPRNLAVQTSLSGLRAVYPFRNSLREKPTEISAKQHSHWWLISIPLKQISLENTFFYVFGLLFFFFLLTWFDFSWCHWHLDWVDSPTPFFSTFIKLFGLVFFLLHSLGLEPNWLIFLPGENNNKE